MTVSGNDTPEAFKREVADSQTLGVLRPLLGGGGGGGAAIGPILGCQLSSWSNIIS